MITKGNRMMKNLKTLALMSLMLLGALNAGDRMYINGDDLDFSQETFRFHIGENIWLQTNTVHRDGSGLYTLESDIHRSTGDSKIGYEKKWRCPYCNYYWPIGTKCQNPDCPSKYY
jgi:hypothetical protein